MRNTVIWSFLSLVALATGGLVAGCDGDAKLARSGAGDSCTKTADCDDGLRCEEGTCFKSGSSTGGSANAGGDNTGATTTGPAPVVLGGEGESCTKHTDCEADLGCFNLRCVKSDSGAGGEGSGSAVVLGQPGETCTTSADCEKSLSCVPGGYTTGTGIGFIGVCSSRATVTPTGKTCGAECSKAADCCELPIELHTAYFAGVYPYGTGATSCAQLTTLLKGVDCAKPLTLTAPEAAQCFAQATYCECGKSTWSCDAGMCHYAADCKVSGAAPDGCPSFSRSGISTPTTVCNADGACAATRCAKDADCDNGSTGDAFPQICGVGDCICEKASGSCYKPCNNTLDCAAGYDCDAKTKLCNKQPDCTTDEECVVRTTSKQATCVSGVCQRGCNSDLECGTTAITGVASQVCTADHICQPVGCGSDAQCTKAVGASTLHMFCTDDVPAVGGITSAVTD